MIDKTIYQTLTVQVPCQFGDGLHPLTIVVNEKGALLGLRSACDHLPNEIKETAKALAGDDYTCCAEYQSIIQRFLNTAREYRSWSLETKLKAELERFGAVGLLPELVEGAVKYAANVQNDRRDRARQEPEEQTTLLDRKYSGLLTAHLGVPTRFRRAQYVHDARDENGRRIRTQTTVVFEASYRLVATYAGKGVWKVDPKAVKWYDGALEFKKVCPVCKVKNTPRHRRTAKHQAKLEDRITSTLGILSSRLHRDV